MISYQTSSPNSPQTVINIEKKCFVFQLIKNELFHVGRSKENVKHAQLQKKHSKLNAHHIFYFHVNNSPACHKVEYSIQYLFICPIYLSQQVL